MAAQPRLRSGDLRHRVIVRRNRKTRDPAGGWIETMEPLKGGVPAAVEVLAGKELMVAKQSEPRATHRVRMRYDPEVAPLTALDELEHTGRDRIPRTLNILRVDDVGERGLVWVVVCEEAGARSASEAT